MRQNLVKLAIPQSFPTFYFELVPVRAFEHDPLFSLIDYRSRLAAPWTNFSYYPVFQEVAQHWVAREPLNKFRLSRAGGGNEPLLGYGGNRYNEKPQEPRRRNQPSQAFLDP